MSALDAYERQVSQLPQILQNQECGLIELGRCHARNFDVEGDTAAGGGVQRVLSELRKLAADLARSAPKGVVLSPLDELRARRERSS